ncbi:glycoside hydrolase family 2 TIM barrel-domain containing protein [Lysobacter sp. CFH 32150]|uniref:glycoside hydrolase family 2 protein n=1 Tax=Lysobacter sp. CFH 32150 TaxID=2927128 RepID=UPI001FA797F4|nr:glycoside hydrolase family 2 TIM barrel-domain containing protein [Lysobacter sp. CFH 32150]MCI4566363.1 beta galactosidase jelly roll domain-containing protein [Lysobacter sp. CFH 32150]
MAIRADSKKMRFARRLAIALLTLQPLLAKAQGYTARPQERVREALPAAAGVASAPLTNLPARKRHSLNGKWQVLVDPYASGIGDWKAVWKDRTAESKTEFYEYGFDDTITLDVPGDFNTQRRDLTWLEGSVWYRKAFRYELGEGRRLFVHFGGANYRADVFLNGKKLGSHEGGFTPFQFELTDLLQDGENRLLVHVNNDRRKDGVPAQGFDWFNYGGLTRDVDLVETPRSYIQDYSIQLAPDSLQHVDGWVKVAGGTPRQQVTVRVPELKVDVRTQTDADGYARVRFDAQFALWSPEQPKLYRIEVSTRDEALEEDIGFRSLAVRGDEILLNGKPLFLRGVNLHEEIDGRRAHSEADAKRLLEQARQLGANFVRLAHYPHNEHLVRLADRMGLLLWQEIPVYQGIDFADAGMQAKLETMLAEMVGRDRNRAAVALWGIANETSPNPQRDTALSALAQHARRLDPTRLVSAALYAPGFDAHTLTVADPLVASLDVVGVNEYFGWYTPWPVEPEQAVWKPFGKPLLISEFGAEARYGNHGADDVASGWNEEFQAEFYRKQLRMLERIPFLRGVVPWVLMDFRSPVRIHPFQAGYNRKGLLSERGERKLAWQIIRDYYVEAKL